MAKKSSAPNHKKQQTTSMSPSRSHTVGGVVEPPAQQDEDDDICPVCESECTCGNRQDLEVPSVANASVPHPPALQISTARPPLKIKLTLPPHLKVRQDHASDNHSASHGEPHLSTPVLANGSHAQTISPTQPKRRGRPPKAVVAAREAARLSSQVVVLPQPNSPFAQIIPDKKAPVSRPGNQRARNAPSNLLLTQSKGAQRANPRSAHTRHPTVTSTQKRGPADHGSDSDAYPTFVSAASSSSLTDSSESSEGDSSSEESSDAATEEEPHNKPRHQRVPGKQTDNSDPESAQKRRDYGSGGRWEIRSRMRSVGPEEDVVGESAEGSSDDGGVDDDDDDEEDNAENDEADDAEADVEDDSHAEIDEDDDDPPALDGKLGVSFGGWSEDDEESSFDADIFFANLDGSSDSSCSPAPSHAQLPSGPRRDFDFGASFSADEDDALLLMDIDSSVHIRRGHGEIEFSIPIDDLPFSWADQHEDTTFKEASHGASDSDVDMTVGSRSGSSTEDLSNMTDGGVVLEETEGDTTEDELVDANGLPNPRAMMLFRWPATVSAIDPRSTVSTSKVTQLDPPHDASPSTRIALATFSALPSSPPPTPADILSGRRFSVDDYEEMEGRQLHFGHIARPAGAYMGHFVKESGAQSFAVVDGSGADTPSPFPRTNVHKRRKSSLHHPSTTNECSDMVTREDAPSSQEISQTSDGLHIPPASSDENSLNQFTSESLVSDAIELDDVLDPSFLNLDMSHLDRAAEGDNTLLSAPNPHLKSFNRWDRIPVATFRQTRETAPMPRDGSETRNTSMAHTILGTPKPEGKSTKLSQRWKGKGIYRPGGSPSLRPPNELSPFSTHSDPQNQQNKSRKEPRKDRTSSKRKIISKSASRHVQQPHQHHHHHNHYPNMKTRGTSSIQRTNFFAPSGSSTSHLTP